jgi:hypothetical protein
LASLDISGQWPVFEQEPHLTDGAIFVVSKPTRGDAHCS